MYGLNKITFSFFNVTDRIKKKLIGVFIGTILTSTTFALDLAQQPLTLSGFNYPNVMFLLDDSGSMDWEIMSGVHWAPCDYDSKEYGSQGSTNYSSCNRKIIDGRMYIENVYGSSDTMTYVFNNTGNIYGICSGWYSYGFECSSSSTGEWRQRSSDLNFMFYNPNTTYNVWDGECSSGVDCADASFTAARSNPRNGETGYSSTRNLSGEYYQVWFDTAGFSGTRPNITDYTSGSNGYVDLWDEHYKIEFVSTGQIKVYRYIYTSPSSTSLGESFTVWLNATSSSCLNILGSRSLVDSIHDGSLSVSSTGGAGCRTISEAAQNFANWYQYHRKRSFSAKSTVSSLVTDEEDIRFGLTLINDYNDVFVEVPAGGQDTFSSHNDALMTELYTYNWQGQGTPLRSGLKIVGEYFDGDLSGKTDPIQYSCQQNFTVLLTDGEWNGSSPSIGNSDGDSYSDTLADVADFYYQNDLSALDNDVAINAFDTQTQQHMVTFMAAFGLEGTLVDGDGDGWPDPILGRSSVWGGNPTSSSYKADDMWHAAFNSKGIYSAAKSPELLQTNLEAAFSSIQARVGSASSVATSSSVLQEGAIIYQSEYNSAGWKGSLKAYEIIDDEIQTATWDSACYFGDDCSVSGFSAPQIAYSSRVIVTSVDGIGIPFRWPVDPVSPSSTEFSATQITDITGANNTSYDDDTYGQKLINFIRGSDSDEVNVGNTSGDFRQRDNTLGDFVNSRPIYISSPNRFYTASLESASYAAFKSTYNSRTPMLYVGGNDGMLHAFDASNGQEKLAYIPGTSHIFGNLPRLSSTTYSHLYFVDGSPTEGDVFYDSAWHTVLAGGLSAGGQAVYLLDITNPANFSEANASSLVKWEFTDVDDAELGMTFSQPKIVRMSNGKWAVIFGNGYNNTASDGNVSATGKSHLFILFLNDSFDGTWDEGVDYIKIPVGSSYLTAGDAAGLSHVQAIDTDGDFDVDYIYGGDVKGRMWRFDVRSSAPASWTGTLVFSAGINQPITTKPSVTSHPTGIAAGFQVFFGTGKFIELDDNSTSGQTTQSLYSIWDKIVSGSFSAAPSVSNLLEQEIISEPNFSSDVGGRLTTDNAIDWATHRGWYLNLEVQDSASNYGERIISNLIIRNNRVVFTTMLPSTDNICDGGGGGWLMSLEASTGSRPVDKSFDLNADGTFTSADYVTSSGADYISSGIQFNSGILATPTILNSANGTYDLNILSGTGGENSTSGLDAIKTSVPNYAVGRLSWRRMR